ncbi:hypothetical protein TeGR_g9867 [Tetraparma gracilis]|uniref:Uncharacterized protein n=1 Tax=Tetraparma gracilis TaxID=2962635 RepID=A0ABQ6MXR3_9STRA|nr:hypothetical protein TeGR_g9867 [Tetraparma gracilis]
MSSSNSSSWLQLSLSRFSGAYATNCEPWRVLEAKSDPRSSRWCCHPRSVGTKGASLTFRLEEKSLASYLEIQNGGCTEIEVWVGLNEGSHNMVMLKSGVRLAANRLNEVKLGHIPCNFVEIRCKKGSPFSIFQLRCSGIPTENIGAVMGPSTEYLLYRATETLLYGPSLRLTRPLAKKRGDKMRKVGGDLTDKSYSYLTNLTTPPSMSLHDDRVAVDGVNMHQRKLDNALHQLSMIAKVPPSPDLYAILPKGVGGRAGLREETAMGGPGDEVLMMSF